MMRRIIISAVLLVFAFGLGFASMWLRSRVITLRARGNPASADRLSGLYESYNDHMQVSWCS
jgi:hypothetical protein